MRVDLFDFELPEHAIALKPAVPREAARMLEVEPGPGFGAAFHDWRVGDLPSRLRAGDALVVNDTRVVSARLSGVRYRNGTAAHIDVTLHKRVDAATWRAFARPAKRLALRDHLVFDAASGSLSALVLQKAGGEVTLEFDRAGDALDAAADLVGQPPLPPYIESRRAIDAADRSDYQTLFARVPGAVAAPTAGLHFTQALLDDVTARGVEVHRVTLHVGAGTFLPVKSETTEDHVMHAEAGEVSVPVAEALNRVHAGGGRVVAVGTTSLRVLESAAAPDGTIQPFADETSIFLKPGDRFRAVDGLLTNFHLPRSTLFMLVSAFAGLETMRDAYAHAIRSGYRFYSYGDASLLWRRGPEFGL